jgi:hypothetical protein
MVAAEKETTEPRVITGEVDIIILKSQQSPS